ncbi:hypothetical protein [Bosea sp. (in: a-proteobacteria)]|jgi:hypothetical protein|uniref:hypothetical protein n=1 Tax=Bosea sp. (in: a-proteobacteria) TaxID=1871050 RepID=UPI002B4AA2D6|nr:hypothetical protein [Bosea sp. (in: a-proteobacteria)]WRH56122.1 MAG: hypothetical protein RSE11_13780 [Bosea sp. (in: a-proteobacteria)]
MKLRLLTHALILALFLTAGVLAAYVSPATAGMARDAAGIEQTMEADMPCCPSDQNGPKDCTTNCPALTFCLAKCFVGGTAKAIALAGQVMAVVALLGDDAERASQNFVPPTRPPRS